MPAAETRWIGLPPQLSLPRLLLNQQLFYQWDFNGQCPISWSDPVLSYTATTSSNSACNYTLVVSNSFGVSTSTVATLSVLIAAKAGYEATIVADKPLSYFRLDETSRAIAYDYAGGNNGDLCSGKL